MAFAGYCVRRLILSRMFDLGTLQNPIGAERAIGRIPGRIELHHGSRVRLRQAKVLHGQPRKQHYRHVRSRGQHHLFLAPAAKIPAEYERPGQRLKVKFEIYKHQYKSTRSIRFFRHHYSNHFYKCTTRLQEVYTRRPPSI